MDPSFVILKYEKENSRSIKNIMFYMYLLLPLWSFPHCILFRLKTYTSRYDKIITNVSKVNRLNQMVKIEISDEIWDIVAGKKLFEKGRQYEIINNIRSEIKEMSHSTNFSENRQYLEVSSRALLTLEKYVDRLGNQISTGAPVAENEVILEEVRELHLFMTYYKILLLQK